MNFTILKKKQIMKITFNKGLITLLILSFFGSLNLKAQHDFDINAAGIFYKNFGIDYEHIFNDQVGVGLSYTYSQNTLGMSIPSGAKFSASDIVPEFKYYPIPSQGGDRLFISIYLKYKMATWKDMTYNSDQTYYDLSFNGMAMGFQLGYKMLFRSSFYIEPSIGMGRFLFTNWDDTADKKLQLSKSENNDYTDDFMFNWDLRFAISIGYRIGGNAAK